ncbi:MAG TPA: NAD-dependent epimerase/dehydratase family protein [Chloroflexaceae bacterium]|nr:NAD-dependent epimerase/dehydratase family protein [Chloroflexaceae bacterium]
MRILIIGGTVFLGRHLAEQALARGHELSLFTRGRHNPELFPEAERLRGDRERDLSALEGREWDAVIDTSGYVPRHVRASVELLAPRVAHYTFISTISVYPTYEKVGIDEGDPVGELPDSTVEEVTGETYGPLKALCERAAEAAMPGRVLTVRPGLIVGPHDPTDRFTYWPWRLARGGPFLAPEGPGYLVQYIDARDLAAWTLDMVEAGRTGVYNATGPAEPQPLGELLAACAAAAGMSAEPAWASAAFLEEGGVQPWVELPLWVPDTPEHAGFSRVSVAKAVAAGLRFRPTVETCADTLAWARSRPADHQWRAGLAPEKEAALLARLGASDER